MLSAIWTIFAELAPWLLLGTAVAGLLHVWLPAEWIRGRLRGPRGVVEASLLGVPLPLCSCGVIPAGIGLKKDGASDGASVGFLISTPQTGVDSILVAAAFLGWPFALFKTAAAFVTGIVGGLVVEYLGRKPPEPPAADDFGLTVLTEPVAPTPHEPPAPVGPAWRRAVDHGQEILRSIWLWVLFGVVVSAAITTWLQEDTLKGVDAMGGVVPGLVALGVSLPFYVCATASVPMAAALVSTGLSTGTALVFLMAGPATNVATIGAVFKQFGRTVTAVYLGTIVVGSLAFAMLFDQLVPNAAATVHDHGHDHTAWWATGSAVALAGLFGWFAVDDLRRVSRRWFARPVDADGDAIRVPVEGMTCHGCTGKLESALRSTDGVQAVEVRLEPGEAIVRGDVDEATVRTVIRGTGFRDVTSVS